MNHPKPQTEAPEVTARRIWAGMRTLVLDVDGRKREVAEALGMSFVRSKALRRLLEGPVTMRRLAEKLGTDAPYTTLIVDDLERQDLVERSVNPNDRRSKLVTVTEAGRVAAETADRILDRPPTPLAGLPAEDLATLDRIVALLLHGADHSSELRTVVAGAPPAPEPDIAEADIAKADLPELDAAPGPGRPARVSTEPEI